MSPININGEGVTSNSYNVPRQRLLLMRKKILITGASGFIGSFLVEEALRQEYEVYAGIRATSSKVFLRQPQIRFFEMDFSSPDVLRKQCVDHIHANGLFDYVIHNAGTTGTKGKKEFLTVNYQYTKHLVDALVDSGMPVGKFLFVSSLATCGPGNPLTFEPIQHTGQESPISAYGKSKLKAEQYIKSMAHFPYLIVKPTAVYGPRDKDFLRFFNMINHGVEPYVGKHRQMISMIYVKDFAKAVMQLMSSASVNTSYLVSDGLDYEKEHLGEVIRTLLNKKTIKFSIPVAPLRALIAASEKVQQLFGKHPFLNLEKFDELSSSNWRCDSSHLWKALSISPEYSLEAGLKETADWYKMNGWLK